MSVEIGLSIHLLLKGTPQSLLLFYPVLLVYKNMQVHRVTKMTPAGAMNKSKHFEVRINLEMKRKHSRIYPEVNVGDTVNIYIKIQISSIKNVCVFGVIRLTLCKIVKNSMVTNFENGRVNRLLVRSNLLLIE